MSLFSRVKAGIDKYQDEADERAQKGIAKLTTKTERDEVRAELKKRQLKISKEIAEAQTATNKAQAANKKAGKEIGDVFSAIRKVHNNIQETLHKKKAAPKRKRKTTRAKSRVTAKSKTKTRAKTTKRKTTTKSKSRGQSITIQLR